jgi:hypothetical protein
MRLREGFELTREFSWDCIKYLFYDTKEAIETIVFLKYSLFIHRLFRGPSLAIHTTNKITKLFQHPGARTLPSSLLVHQL